MEPIHTVSIIVNGNVSVTKRYTDFAAKLVMEGFRVRLLTYLKHHDAYEENYTEYNKKLSSEQSSNLIHVNIPKRCNLDEDNFFSLMKNMSPEMQSLVRVDSRLQVSMAKCESKEFMTLLKNVYQSKELCQAILEDLQCHPPDLVITGQGCDYFSLYAKHVLRVMSTRVILESLQYENPIESFDNHVTLENAMISLGFPSLGSRILPPGDKIAINTVKYSLRSLISLHLKHGPSNDNQIATEIKEIFFDL